MDDPLLDRPTTIELPATSGRFVVKDHFVLNMGPGERVLISYILGNFQRWFLEKVEEPIAATTLCSRELQRDAPDTLILPELGGEKEAETTLTEIFALMEMQRKGQGGFLAFNGWGNIFYVRDAGGVLRAVDVHWCDGGWNVEATRVGTLTEWPIRDRIVSRRPV